MFFQKVLFFVVRLVSRVFWLTSSHSSYCHGEACSKESYWITFGPRVFVERKDGYHTLTGLFEVVCLYGECGKLLSCKPLVMTLEKGDRLFFGCSAHKRCQELMG